MRIFLDANILFSAARADGAIRTLLALLRARQHILVASPSVLIEARRNLEHKANATALSDLVAIQSTLEISSREHRDGSVTHTAWLPTKDRLVLAAAIALKCDALVTGDKTHFGSGYGERVGNVLILSPRMAAERLL